MPFQDMHWPASSGFRCHTFTFACERRITADAAVVIRGNPDLYDTSDGEVRTQSEIN